jgi:hypothetical protein
MNKGILPHGERIRRAIRWISGQSHHDSATIEEASQLFDLSPIEEDFLLRYFRSAPAEGRRLE